MSSILRKFFPILDKIFPPLEIASSYLATLLLGELTTQQLEYGTLGIVTASNVFSLIPIFSFLRTGRYGGALITGCASIASIFMHISETKHELPGLWLAKYSNYFLNIDRFFAGIAGMYGLFLFYTNSNKTTSQVALPLVGSLTLFIGEHTTDLPLYTITHTIWHFIAYYSLALVNH